MYQEIENRISVVSEIFNNLNDYLSGSRKDEMVVPCYYNLRKDRITRLAPRCLNRALAFARGRMSDGRYGNYEILIETI